MREKRFLILNMLIPVLLAACFYIWLAPDVIFVQKLESCLGVQWRLFAPSLRSSRLKLLRNYGPDACWAYSLQHALYLILGKEPAALRKSLVIAMIFSGMLELLQLTAPVPGTFDPADLAIEAAAEIAAALMIEFYEIREVKK